MQFLSNFDISLFKHLLWDYWTKWNETWHDCSLGQPWQIWCFIFLILRKSWLRLLKIEHRGQTHVFCLYPWWKIKKKLWELLPLICDFYHILTFHFLNDISSFKKGVLIVNVVFQDQWGSQLFFPGGHFQNGCHIFPIS